MTEELLTAATKYFRKEEGVVSHMYLDTHKPPLVTVGVGFMIPTAEAAVDYPFVNRHSTERATPSAIRAEWRAINKLPGSKVASWYRPYTTLDLPDADIERLLRDKLQEFDAGLAKAFSLDIPEDAHLGLLDMAYSMGIHGLTTKYPKFCAAVRARDWATCAAECERKNVSKERNKATRALFAGCIVEAGRPSNDGQVEA